jgi:PRC-barrel domain protein
LRGGRAALAAIAAAGAWAGLHLPAVGPTLAQTVAQRLAQSSSVQSPAGETSQQTPAAPPKQADDTAPKLKLVSILGREVVNREGDGGRVIDVLVDQEGRLGAVVVEFGGFMGIGSRKVAVDWSALRFLTEGNRTSVIVDVSRDQIRGAPEYKPNEPPSVLGTK